MSTASQIYPPAPTFTEASIIDLSQKVYIITGATSGIGIALAKILYKLHATVYIGARSLDKFNKAVEGIKEQCLGSQGELKPFIADLADLATIKPSVDGFLKQEWRLDVLFLNAGVMTPPAGSKTKQGYDLELGVHCLASFLLTALLFPIQSTTASHFCHPNPSIRVVWVSSLLSLSTPQGGVQFDSSTGLPKQLRAMENYMQSKAGVYLLAHEFSLRQKTGQLPQQRDEAAQHTLPNSNPSGVQQIVLNPGFTRTGIHRSIPALIRGAMTTAFKGAEYGAYTELYAGLGPDVKSEDFVIPWGRKGSVPNYVKESIVAKDGEVDTVSARFYEWCEKQVKQFI
ncbi:short-chain dehydrogenase [Pyrenochaeta sp. MPI-SDFR-AT-0127]|nr:short-chain dehydrogenase [Pyrenochaeta sp. MPI-SDFR-AT-0127]